MQGTTSKKFMSVSPDDEGPDFEPDKDATDPEFEPKNFTTPTKPKENQVA